MKQNAEAILVKGLKAGYVGRGKQDRVQRGPFTLKSTEHISPEDNASYIDQWIAKRIGGGQEIAQIGDEMVTRVFAGGIVNPDTLGTLGIDEKQILTYLKSKLSELAESTRLHENVEPKADGDWQYKYEVVGEYAELPLTVGIETIRYKGNEVFVHVFLNTPIQ